tara:strand:+ start:44552 stop:44995 length:444 start_codon:yes stop_codon:yes gene_type:complete
MNSENNQVYFSIIIVIYTLFIYLLIDIKIKNKMYEEFIRKYEYDEYTKKNNNEIQEQFTPSRQIENDNLDFIKDSIITYHQKNLLNIGVYEKNITIKNIDNIKTINNDINGSKLVNVSYTNHLDKKINRNFTLNKEGAAVGIEKLKI